MRTTLLQLDVQVLSLLASVIIPGLVAWWTKRNAVKWFKAFVNGVLSVAAAAISVAIAAEGQVVLGDWIMQALITYGMSELSYQRVWKSTGAAGSIADAVPGGIGPEALPQSSLIVPSSSHSELPVPDAAEPAPVPPVSSPSDLTAVDEVLTPEEGGIGSLGSSPPPAAKKPVAKRPAAPRPPRKGPTC